jgi:hypothetical protein
VTARHRADLSTAPAKIQKKVSRVWIGGLVILAADKANSLPGAGLCLKGSNEHPKKSQFPPCWHARNFPNIPNKKAPKVDKSFSDRKTFSSEITNKYALC